jgi:hypothetical protein
MIHLASGLISLLFWVFGISAALFVAFVVFEVVQHRKTYLLDGWSEEALLEERIASGTLPPVMHIAVMEQAKANAQQGVVTKESLAKSIPFVQTASR